MGKTGKDHGFPLDIIPVVFSGAGAEIFQDHRAVPDICCKITDAIPPLTQTFFYMVFPCFSEKNHEFTGLPHSGQRNRFSAVGAECCRVHFSSAGEAEFGTGRYLGAAVWAYLSRTLGSGLLRISLPVSLIGIGLVTLIITAASASGAGKAAEIFKKAPFLIVGTSTVGIRVASFFAGTGKEIKHRFYLLHHGKFSR